MKKICISFFVTLLVLMAFGLFANNKSYPVSYTEDTQMTNFDITMTFAGDVLLAENLDGHRDGGFNSYAESQNPEYFLKNVSQYFKNDDFTLVNLENVLSDSDLSPAGKPLPAFWFKSKTSNTDILTASGVECVSVANNHTRDYGEKGLLDTITALENANLEYGSDKKTVYFEKNGFRVSVICCCMWNFGNVQGIIKRIKEAEQSSDYQIVFFHGGVEGSHTPEDWKISACHSLVDNGADLVIGGHPHVLQKMEQYSGADIVYSLGNFCFGGNLTPENRTILYRMTLTINPNNVLVSQNSEVIPCYVYTGSSNNYQPAVIQDNEQAQKVFNYMNGTELLPY